MNTSCGGNFQEVSMRYFKTLANLVLAFVILLLPRGIRAQGNVVMGQVNFAPASKVEKGAGIWIDGQYVGHVGELKGNKKILLLPGEHEIVARATGYMDSTQKVTVEPGKTLELTIQLARDPHAQFSKVTSEIKLRVDPDRAAVFVDGAFAGYAREFGGVGRSMLLSPGKHEIKIALPGYRDFTTEVNLLPKQKFTLETKLPPGSITQADPSVRQN
jgi:PEGA domain